MNILIAYATLSGNTQIVAEHLSTYLQEKGHVVEMVNQEDFSPTSSGYECVLLGSSTWGDGKSNSAFQMFLEKLQVFIGEAGDVKYAVFGLGDKNYPNFCGVVDVLENLLKEKGKEIAIEGLRIDGYPDDAVFAQMHKWVERVLVTIQIE